MSIIDVSRFQGKVDWDKVKADGVEGVIIRAVSTNTNGLYIDPYFERNYSECKRLGLAVGAYYYTYATNKAYADKELALFKQCVSGKQFELPIVLDVEDRSLATISSTALTDLAIYRLKTIESWGCFRMWYTDLDFRAVHLVPSRLSAFDYWCAYWSTKTPPVPYGIWQYSNSGNVAGITGRVDMNRTSKDYPSIIKNAGLNGYEKPQPEHPPAESEPTMPDDPDEPTDFTDAELSIIRKFIRFLIKIFGDKI